MIFNINKFSNIKFKFNRENKKNFIFSINPNQLNHKNIVLISINSSSIIINNQMFSLKFFMKNLYDKNNLYIVLSKTEFLVNKFKFNLLTNVFPFIKYNNDYDNMDLNTKYNTISILYNNVSNLYNSKFNSIQHQYKTYLSFKQNKIIHYKSSLDNNFFFSIKSGFSDVFKLLENRPNRTIYQLDVNSMYPFAMIQNNFSIPRNLIYHKSNDLNDILNGNITNGIFNCQMTIKKELTNKQKDFIKYLPINLIENNVSIPLHIKFGDTVNILLHCNEIKYYSKFFDITLEDGVYSKKSMDHPLKNWVLETYQKRLNAEGPLKDFYKFVLTVSHSIIMGREKSSNLYDDINLVFEDIYNNYQLNLENLNISNSYFSFEYTNNYQIKSKTYNIDNNKNVYSLYSQVLANARIHLLELYEKFYNENPHFELCYCNVDSLHISIPNQLNDQFNTILEQVSSKTELGKLKIESISNRGIWFEPGRYWLFKDEELISYKNIIFNDENSDYDCIFKIINYIKNNKFSSKPFSLFLSLQHKKRIKSINKNHYIMIKNDKPSRYKILENKNINLKIFKFMFFKYIKKKER